MFLRSFLRTRGVAAFAMSFLPQSLSSLHMQAGRLSELD
ncbi:hypothetical protein predicted by Glimmer/Critica [Acetobacter ghanensis]|uniref:Uncharacterized protein n=1 Tax=Acetobacter ghanensis TaxID=431306 RepID=A0A0U5F322_9PROT|nr:hypothetical protein predicted by Glimmer/Critica [Acetobacter ghanensis]